MKKVLIIFIASLFGLLANAQSYSISGYITDKKNRETLIGATIIINPVNKAVVSDKYGFYTITGLKPGSYELIISHIGYAPVKKTIALTDRGLVLDEIKLTPVAVPLKEVSIMAIKPDKVADREIEIGQKVLTPKLIESIPTARNDIFSAIKYLPGIDRTEPFSPLYTTRGGDPGENAVLLDGVMIYNPYHSSVTSGIFNTQTIKNVDLLVGGFSAEYGGRNSSVMYITTKDGNSNRLHGEVEPSTFHSKVFLEFPAGKNASMVIAGRYLYDIPYNFLFQNTNYFYDYNISYTKRLNNRNRLTIKYFESKDFTGYNFNTFYRYLGNSFGTDIYDDFTLEQRNRWMNRSATVIHKLILTPRIYMRNQVYYSTHASNNYSGLDFLIKLPNENNDTLTLQWASNSKISSEIQDLSAKSTLSFQAAAFNEIRLGAEYNTYQFKNSIRLNDVDNGSLKRYPALLSVFAENVLTTPYFIFRPGIRLTQYRHGAWLTEPRVNIVLNLPYSLKLKAAYGEFLQYIISMNTNEIEMSQIVDYYYPIWDKPPSKSIHYIVGLEKRLTPSLQLSIDGYFKDITTTYTFDVNQDYSENYLFSNKLAQGSGKAYGLEFYLHGRARLFSGWIAYSWARATRRYPESEINNGKEHPFDYTRAHTIKSVMNYQVTPNFAFNTSFLFQSGIHRSIETTTQSYYLYNPSTNKTNHFPLYASAGKNKAKMPPLINLDISIRKKLVQGTGKKLADFFKAEESYVTITVRNILFLYRNVEYYYPGTFIEPYYDKYIPFGSNYIPQLGISYTLKF